MGVTIIKYTFISSRQTYRHVLIQYSCKIKYNGSKIKHKFIQLINYYIESSPVNGKISCCDIQYGWQVYSNEGNDNS